LFIFCLDPAPKSDKGFTKFVKNKRVVCVNIEISLLEFKGDTQFDTFSKKFILITSDYKIFLSHDYYQIYSVLKF